MKIAVDFDNSCVEKSYPEIGQDVPGAVETMKFLISQGHRLILYTMRHGNTLEDAKKWFSERGIELYGEQYDPEQFAWTTSNKCFYELLIDDMSLNCPLIMPDGFNQPVVNWFVIPTLIQRHMEIHSLV